MKFKSLFIAALAILAFSACDKKKDDVKLTDGNIGLTLRIQQGETRSVEAPLGANVKTTIAPGSKIYYLVGESVIGNYVLDAAAITAATSTTGLKLTDVPSSANALALVANSTAPAGVTPTKTALFNQAFDVMKENEGTGVANVTLVGEGAIVPGTGNTATATIKAAAVTARIEMAGNFILSANDATGNKWVNPKGEMTEFDMQVVYADNYKTTYNLVGSLVNIPSKKDFLTTNPTGYPLFTDVTAAQYAALGAKTSAVAHHVFKGEAPMIVIKCSYKVGTEEMKDKYITLTKINTMPTGNTLVPLDAIGVEGNKVYRIDLAKIDWNGNGNFDDPTDPSTWKPIDPNQPVGPNNPVGPDIIDPTIPGDTPHAKNQEVNVIAEVAEWTFVEIIPGI